MRAHEAIVAVSSPGALSAAIAYALFAAVSVWLSIVDVKTHRLPNMIVLPLYPVLLILFGLASWRSGDWARLLTAVLAAVMLLLLYAALRAVGGGVGGGDVKLAGTVGLSLGYVGWPEVLLGTCVAFLLGGIVALALLLMRRATRDTRIAFGPFLLGGAWLVLAASVVT